MSTLLDDFFWSALNIGNAFTIVNKCDTGILLSGVKGVEVTHLILVHSLASIAIYKEGHQCTVGTITAYDLAITCNRAVINADARHNISSQRRGHLGQSIKNSNVSGCHFNNRKATLGNSTSLVAKQDAQAASGFKTVDFTHKDVILCHAQALEGQQDRGQHGQTFWNSAYNDGNCNGNCIHNEANPLEDIFGDATGKQGLCQNTDDNGDCTDIAKCGDLFCKLT